MRASAARCVAALANTSCDVCPTAGLYAYEFRNTWYTTSPAVSTRCCAGNGGGANVVGDGAAAGFACDEQPEHEVVAHASAIAAAVRRTRDLRNKPPQFSTHDLVVLGAARTGRRSPERAHICMGATSCRQHEWEDLPRTVRARHANAGLYRADAHSALSGFRLSARNATGTPPRTGVLLKSEWRRHALDAALRRACRRDRIIRGRRSAIDARGGVGYTDAHCHAEYQSRGRRHRHARCHGFPTVRHRGVLPGHPHRPSQPLGLRNNAGPGRRRCERRVHDDDHRVPLRHTVEPEHHDRLREWLLAVRHRRGQRRRTCDCADQLHAATANASHDQRPCGGSQWDRAARRTRVGVRLKRRIRRIVQHHDRRPGELRTPDQTRAYLRAPVRAPARSESTESHRRVVRQSDASALERRHVRSRVQRSLAHRERATRSRWRNPRATRAARGSRNFGRERVGVRAGRYVGWFIWSDDESRRLIRHHRRAAG